MSLYSTTLPSQPPPLHPRSTYDVSSFDILTKSLRQHPDLASESDKILNSFQLAKLIDGIKRFQDEHLGMKNKYRPTLRLPTPLLHDRSTSGPLHTALISAFRVKQSSPWRNFNFDNPKLFDDNIALLKRMEGDLVNAGLLVRPRVYFDGSVERGVGVDEKKRLVEVAKRFGATVVTDESEVSAGKVTHIVAYDPEEHDGGEILADEQQNECEKKFLRTLGVFDIPVEEGGTKCMALVHWWYFPSSYDEWMEREDVAGDVEEEVVARGPGGAAAVGCKFIRDVEKFNEWGAESDYAVMDFERKLEYLRTHPNNSTQTSTTSNKKRKKQTSAETTNEPSSKKPKRSSFTDSTTSDTKTRTICERRTKNTTARRIQTGIKGTRGEIIRRTVYDSALRVDDDAYRIVREACADFAGYAPLLGAKPEWRRYLPMNSLIRPTVDGRLGSCLVTELSEGEEGEGTVVIQREVPVLSDSNVVAVKDGDGETLRIRGGGEVGDDDNEAVDLAIEEADNEAENIGNDVAEELNQGELDVQTDQMNVDNPAGEFDEQTDQTNVNNPASGEDGIGDTGGDNELKDQGAEVGEATTNDTPQEEAAVIDTPTQAPDVEESAENLASEELAQTDEAISSEAMETDPAVPLDDGPTDSEKTDVTTENCKDVSDVEKEVVPNAENEVVHPPDKLPQSAPTADTPSSVAQETPSPATQETSAVEVVSSAGNGVEASGPVLSDGKPIAEKSTALCEIKSLESTHQLSSSLYHPTAPSHEESSQVSASWPSWYDKSKASDFEQRSLPEWFNQSAPHRTPSSYIAIREQVLDLAKRNKHQYITATALRRTITCDSGSIMRLHSFLTDWGFINRDQVGESAPSEIRLRDKRASWTESGKNTKRKFSEVQRSVFWSPSKILELERAVLACISKKTGSDGRAVLDIDWEKVCATLGGQVSVNECQYMFIQAPTKECNAPPQAVGAPTQSQETFYSNIFDSVRPEVLEKVINTSLNATQDINEARKASLVGAIAGVSAEKAHKEEEQIKATMMDIIDQRVQRLENRIALIDDVEALLEAERVSLELERRDMYTTRCRQWFGDGSS